VGIVTVVRVLLVGFFFFSSRRRHTRFDCDWSSDVCSSDLEAKENNGLCAIHQTPLVRRNEPCYFFALSKFQDRLLKFYEVNPNRSEERRVGKESRTEIASASSTTRTSTSRN